MNTRTHLVGSVALVVVGLSAAGSLRAQGLRQIPGAAAPTTMPAAVQLPHRAAPGALDPAKRSMRIAAALKASNLVGSAPQTLETRLTPLAPKTSGAEILAAGPIVYSSPEPGQPDGEYAFGAGSGMVSLPFVRMRFNTEPGKLYVIDCRLQAAAGASKMTVSIGKPNGAGTMVQVEDGHAIHAMQATTASTEVHLLVVPAPNSTQNGFFHGCDFGKVQ